MGAMSKLDHTQPKAPSISLVSAKAMTPLNAPPRPEALSTVQNM